MENEKEIKDSVADEVAPAITKGAGFAIKTADQEKVEETVAGQKPA